MLPMRIFPACPDQLDVILSIIDQARTLMRETGNHTQWTGGYPSADVLLGDMTQGAGYVCVEAGQIVGYFAFLHGPDPEPSYAVIDGQWLDDAPYGVIHRLASGRMAKGIAAAAFGFAFSVIGNIRVDTHADNLPMRRFLEKSGFSYCGVIYLSDGSPRDAFQKRA